MKRVEAALRRVVLLENTVIGCDARERRILRFATDFPGFLYSIGLRFMENSRFAVMLD